MSRLSANNTKMYYKRDNTDTSFTELEYLMEVPEFGGTPEKIDVTVLSDKVKNYVAGIKDYGDLVFKFLYDNSSETSNYRVLKALDAAQTLAEFKLEYPDGSSHTFKAVPAVKMDAGAVNGALTFSVTMITQGEVTAADSIA